MSELTPLMKQYHDIKRNYPGAIVFFRLGDFYEMFGQDAITAAKVLQITLTSRDKGKEDPVPMCGVPHFTAETYIARLVKAGHKVAVCEQMEDPKEAKGIVRREVVRVVTPGTFLPENPKENSYILGFFQKDNIYGIAVADITTGEFSLYETFSSLEDEINRFQPKEVLYPYSFKNNSAIMDRLEEYYLTGYDDWYFDYIEAYRKLIKHFKVSSLEGYGCEGMIVAISAAGALLNYLEETQREALSFKKLSVLRRETRMLLDAVTLRNLEITRNMRSGEAEGSLLWVMDETLTPMGGRLLRTWLLNPLLEPLEIRGRQDAVSALMEGEGIAGIQNCLKGIYDIERLASRVGGGTANARDLAALKNSLKMLPELRTALFTYDNAMIKGIADLIDPLEGITALIEKAIVDDPPFTVKEGGMIREGFHREIDELREISRSGKDFIANLQAKERERTGISSLKVGYNRVFGYYIEVTKTNLGQVPDDYIRKQTLANGERFITPELKEYEGKILGAEERLKNLEYDAFISVRNTIAAETGKLQMTSAAVAELDALHSLAVIARRYQYERPVVDDGDVIQIVEGRHPVIERLSPADKFIPNDSLIDSGTHSISIITGPNMAGKSTYMRQIALIVLMAQTGSFVPAKEARVGVADRIFTRIGASDVITKGQSTFMVEMIETANILNNATRKSLILLDEVGRGTSTFDGISIAWAVVEYIAKTLRARTLFATHYHELTELSLVLDGISNLNVAVREWGDEIIFLRRIEEGSADKSYGIQVARLAGLPQETVDRAKEILANLEKSELNELGAPRLAYTSASTSPEKTGAGQLDLFSTQADPVIRELLGLDVLGMTPIEALNKLFEMKKKLGDTK